jgi:hypothetical protein
MKPITFTLATAAVTLMLAAGCKQTTETETTPTATTQTETTTSLTGVSTETTSTQVTTDTSTVASTDTSRAALKQDASKIGSDLKDAAHHAAVATGTALEKAGQKLQKEGSEKH